VTVGAVQSGADRMLTISGQVNDSVLGGDIVTISGIASGTATTDSSGHYSLVVQATSQGTISAFVTDVWGLISSAVQTTFTAPAPAITSFSDFLSGRYWAFDGTVEDAMPAGVTVTFWGVTSGSCDCQADGSFTWVSSLQLGAASGMEYAQAVDCWGNVSNIATCWVG
jgi:hypothetical protein